MDELKETLSDSNSGKSTGLDGVKLLSKIQKSFQFKDGFKLNVKITEQNILFIYLKIFRCKISFAYNMCEKSNGNQS